MNAIWSEACGAAYVPELAGDRVVYDFVVTGGDLKPEVVRLAAPFDLPSFSGAIWDDLVAIRRDSEALGRLREIVRDAAGVTEASALPSLEARLEAAASKLKAEAGLWRAVRGATSEFALGMLCGAGGVLAFGGTPATLATGAALGATSGLSATVLLRIFGSEHQELRRRAELVSRISTKLSTGSR